MQTVSPDRTVVFAGSRSHDGPDTPNSFVAPCPRRLTDTTAPSPCCSRKDPVVASWIVPLSHVTGGVVGPRLCWGVVGGGGTLPAPWGAAARHATTSSDQPWRHDDYLGSGSTVHRPGTRGSPTGPSRIA